MPANSDSTSWSAVLGTARGDAAHQARFCARYEPVIRGHLAARWRVDRGHERVAAATQEVILRCLRTDGALRRVDPSRSGGFRAFLLGIVANVASEFERQDRRHRGTRLDATDAGIDVADPIPSASRGIDRAWAALVVREAWEAVAARLARKRSGALRLQVLRLRYLDDLSVDEIRRLTGLPSARDVHRITATGRYQFRLALLETVARHYPHLEPAEVEDKCRQIVDLL